MKNILNKTRVIHISFAFIMAIVGFGTCLSTMNSVAIIIPALLYILSAIYSLSSVIAVFRKKPSTNEMYSNGQQIFILMIGTMLFVWSAIWGFVGFVSTFSGGFH